jgi:ribosome-binding factor A
MLQVCAMGKSERENGREDDRKRRSRERGVGDCDRLVRLRELIREEVNFVLRNEIRDPRLCEVEITMVELLGECARLWFTSEMEEGTKEALERAGGLLRCRLAENLGLKRTPELRFRRDPATRVFARPEES